MTEHIDSIPDDLPTCQERLRALLERFHDLERQLEEFVATTEELQRSYACLKEEYLASEAVALRSTARAAAGGTRAATPLR